MGKLLVRVNMVPCRPGVPGVPRSMRAGMGHEWTEGGVGTPANMFPSSQLQQPISSRVMLCAQERPRAGFLCMAEH